MQAISRAFAAFLGLFTVANIVGGQVLPGFDANIWWVDLRALPRELIVILLPALGIALLAFAVVPRARPWRRGLTLALVAGVLLVVLANSANFYWLLAQGSVHAGTTVPLSLLLAVGLGLVVWALAKPVTPNVHWVPIPNQKRQWLAMAMGTAGLCVAFPLLQMLCFGHSDYRRRADAIVVFGARAYSDGTPSQALADRVRTGCDLYFHGYAPNLMFSGGPGDGAIHETQAMRHMALQLGVPDRAIILDPQGLCTADTVANTTALAANQGFHRLPAVSHAYHLPRVKLAYQRAGWDVYTVPAHETWPLTQKPRLIAREVVALWWYYLAPGSA